MTESKIDAQASHSSGRDGSALHTQLLARGVRMTAQRAAVVAVLEQFSGHVTAEEVYLAVQPLLPNINLATVYRTLEMMKALGLLSESRLGSAKARTHPMAVIAAPY